MSARTVAGAGGAASTLIQVAMDLEAQPFFENGSAPQFTKGPGKTKVYELTEKGILLAVSGIGLVNAALCTAWVAHHYRLARVISAGTCGGLAATVHVRDVIVGETYAFADANATAFGYVPGQIPGEVTAFAGAPAFLRQVAANFEDAAPGKDERENDAHRPLEMKFGQVLSGNSFVAGEQTAIVRERFPGALSVDMESTAIAMVCAALELPFVSVRGVSDLCGPVAGQDFHIDAEEAAALSAAAVTRLLSHLQ
ncbi:MAG: 5'-methylthioadenosine/S-adenosylhomocysteine nucleosidase [Actinomycetaceae bacterium]|nr:5'-methylthioadenosine/S-adenosylhomocysteine nucleosidase [Actinomycetaceae bacterium]